MKTTPIHIIAVLLLTILGCKKDSLFKDDELTITRHDYNTSQLKIDGYYYQEKDGEFYSLYCFYRNGIIQYLGGGYTIAELKELEERIKSGIFDNYEKTKGYWGVFHIDQNQIQFERWYPSSPGKWTAFIREGKILNDTTFMITVSYRMRKNKRTEESVKSETYRFKKFSPKPDSTNSFIK